jgi:hypothetical protein
VGKTDTSATGSAGRGRSGPHYRSAAGVVIRAAVSAQTVSTSMVMVRAASCRASCVCKCA